MVLNIQTNDNKYIELDDFKPYKDIKLLTSLVPDFDNETDFEVKEDATKAQIRSAFKKSLNGKKMNKKILGEFVELVA